MAWLVQLARWDGRPAKIKFPNVCLKLKANFPRWWVLGVSWLCQLLARWTTTTCSRPVSSHTGRLSIQTQFAKKTLTLALMESSSTGSTSQALGWASRISKNLLNHWIVNALALAARTASPPTLATQAACLSPTGEATEPQWWRSTGQLDSFVWRPTSPSGLKCKNKSTLLR